MRYHQAHCKARKPDNARAHTRRQTQPLPQGVHAPALPISPSLTGQVSRLQPSISTTGSSLKPEKMVWEETLVLKISVAGERWEGAVPPLLRALPCAFRGLRSCRVPIPAPCQANSLPCLHRAPLRNRPSAKMGKGYKVVVCGMASVGKTAILEQLLYGRHTVGETFLLLGGGCLLF